MPRTGAVKRERPDGASNGGGNSKPHAGKHSNGNRKQADKQDDAAKEEESEEEVEIVRPPTSDRLVSNSTYLDELLSLIPHRFYFPTTPNEDSWMPKKYRQNVQGDAPRQAIKEATKKAKRQKLDPDAYRTVMDIQTKGEAGGDSDDDGSDGSDDDEGGSDPKEPAQVVFTGTARERLQQRIASMRTDRKADEQQAKGKKGSDKGKKKDKKRKAGEEGGEGGGEDGPAARLTHSQAKAAARAQAKAAQAGLDAAAAGGEDGDGGDDEGTGKVRLSTSDVDFGKLDYSFKGDHHGMPSKPGISKEALLARAKKRVDKLGKMEEKRPEKAAELKEKQAWGSILDRADGLKIKDDVGKLEKSLRAKEKKKEKSRVAWGERTAAEKETKDGYQDKRRNNIAEHNHSKMAKKLLKKGIVLEKKDGPAAGIESDKDKGKKNVPRSERWAKTQEAKVNAANEKKGNAPAQWAPGGPGHKKGGDAGSKKRPGFEGKKGGGAKFKGGSGGGGGGGKKKK